ncbi:MAG: hypothetical protein CSA81_07665 [Acidobacteria bacterium]|nr:MAG: hypothetical protein CSA81_07665 [Acidobacteriota bacterium]
MLVIYCMVLLTGNPKIAIDQAVVDLGLVVNKQTLQNEFVIRNEGSADLLIKDIESDCSCIVANLQKNTLRPGEQAVVLLEISFPKNSTWSKTVHVFSNDPESPEKRVIIKGTSRDAIIVKPETIRLKANKKSAKVQIESHVNRELEITIEVYPPMLSVSNLKQEGNVYQFNVSYTGDAKNNINGFLIVNTGVEELESVMIPVKVNY